MARALQPCGTYAAYRRHTRNGEEACDLCKQAYRDYKNDRNGYADGADTSTPTLETAEPLLSAPVPRDDALENLRIVNEAMTKAAPNAIPALSKRRQELVEYLNGLNAKEDGGLAEKLANARRAREERNGRADT